MGIAIVGQSLRQAGAIPYRVVDGAVEVLLITSRDTGRWVIPKGYVEPEETAAAAAAKEAFEEAGVLGSISSRLPLGFVPYLKVLKGGKAYPASIEVYPLLVEAREKDWPEKGQRKVKWFSVAGAAKRVDEPALAALIRRLHELASEPSDAEIFDVEVVVQSM